MKLLKLLIPTGAKKEIPVVQSFTVRWFVKEGWANSNNVFHKVFTDKATASEFSQQLKDAASFINAWIKVDVYDNE